MRYVILALALFSILIAGCSPGTGKVKGQIVENGQPKTFPASSHAIEMSMIGANGEPDNMKSFTAVVETDGTFEVLASGGQVPPGSYRVSVQGPSTKKLTAKVAVKREIVIGDNDITIDLAKPTE